MFQRMSALAINTFREAVRDRVLLAMVGAAMCMELFSLVIGELSLQQQKRVVFDLGLSTISLFSVIVAVFLGSALLYKEIERKTLYVILPKPLHRHEFLLGKYFGIALTGFVFIAITGSIQLWITAGQYGASVPSLVASLLGPLALLGLGLWRARDSSYVLMLWSTAMLGLQIAVAGAHQADVAPIVASLTLSFGEVLVLTAVAMVFSAFSTPFLTGVFTTGVWLLGRSADTMATTKSRVLPDVVKSALHGLSQVLPNFHLFVPGRHALTTLSEVGGPGTYVTTTMLYALTYATVLLALAALIFRKRDFL